MFLVFGQGPFRLLAFSGASRANTVGLRRRVLCPEGKNHVWKNHVYLCTPFRKREVTPSISITSKV
jgi:hypothetical protein